MGLDFSLFFFLLLVSLCLHVFKSLFSSEKEEEEEEKKKMGKSDPT